MISFSNIRSALAASAWTPIIAKLVAWGGAFLALAHIGGSSAMRLLDTSQAKPAFSTVIEAGPHSAHAPAGGPSGSPSHHAAAHARSAGGQPPPCSSSKPKAGSAGITTDGKVILNVASVEELVRLPGVGRSRAAAIVALRTKLKRFRRIRDLMRVRGIGYRSLKKIKPMVVLDPPKPIPPKPGAPKPGAPKPTAPPPDPTSNDA